MLELMPGGWNGFGRIHKGSGTPFPAVDQHLSPSNELKSQGL